MWIERDFEEDKPLDVKKGADEPEPESALEPDIQVGVKYTPRFILNGVLINPLYRFYAA